jgi:dihydrofolate reductase
VKAIVAVDEKWGIGAAGKLLAHIPGDLKHFRGETLGKLIVMGRKTLEGLPGGRPLPGRDTVVLSRDPSFDAGCKAFTSFGGCMEYLDGFDGDQVYICGGADIYRQFLPYCGECLVTKIDGDFGADSFFEDLDRRDDFRLLDESGRMEENGISYRFARYARLAPGVGGQAAASGAQSGE